MDAIVAGSGFLIEGFRLDRNGGGLFRADGDLVPLSSRALDILQLLVERNGQLVPKQQIMDAVWPGLAVEEGNLTVQVSALRKALDSGRAGASCIQTVPGRGYRFVVAVRAAGDGAPLREEACLGPEATPVARGAVPGQAPARLRRRVVALLGMGLLALAALLIFGIRQAGWHVNPAAPPRLSILVLPFKNLSGDRGEDYLADAITEDVTTDLASVPGMFVIARQSAYAYQGRTVGLRRVGEELGVRYALEGSVRKVGEVLCVNAQLIATDSGAHLWADRFDQPLKDLSAGQEEIVRRIGQTLNVALMSVESARSRRERPASSDAFDLIIRARSIGLRPMGRREHAERIVLFEQALRLDPTATVALAGLAWELVYRTTSMNVVNVGDEFGRAAKLIADAAAINPNHPDVLHAVAYLLYGQGRYPEAIAAYRRLLDEYPNSHFAYNQIGYCLVFLGRAEEAIPMIETAIRRDPRGPYIYNRYDMVGLALLMLERDEESIVWTQRAMAAIPADYAPRRAQYNVIVAAASARLGRLGDAHRALAEANRIWPYDTVRMHWPDDPTSRVYAAQIESFQAALRLAGHRDHAEEDADFGVVSDDTLHEELAGLTPTTAPGATTIRTTELQRLLAEQTPIVIDPLMYSWGRSIPGAIGLKRAGWGSSYSDAMQDDLRDKMKELAKGDLSAPIVAVGFNSERFDGRNLALRLVRLGYSKVYWYRGGREAWEANGLPETELAAQEWRVPRL